MIDFSFPLGLIALPIGCAVAALCRLIRSKRSAAIAAQPGWKEKLAHWTALIFFTVALGGPVWIDHSETSALIVVWDRSASVSGERFASGFTASEERDFEAIRRVIAALPDNIPAALVDFAGEPRLLRSFKAGAISSEEERALREFPPPANPDRTEPSRAIAFAAGQRPPGTRLDILLLTDGWATEGEGETETLVGAGLLGPYERLFVLPSHGPEQPEMIARELLGPPRLFEDEPATLRLRAWSNRPSQAEARLYSNDLLAATQTVELAAGENEIAFAGLRPPAGLARWTAELIPAPGADTWAINNRAFTGTKSRPAARVLALDPEPAGLESFAAILRAAGFEIVLGGVERLPRTVSDLASYEAVILSDFPAGPLEGSVTSALREWVAGSGGTLIVCGGANAFAAGGYAGSQIEALLPVRSGRPDKLEQSVVAVLVSLDRSGSMQATVGGRPKMELAAKGAAMAMEVLGRNDYFGVHAVDTQVHQILPLSSGFDRDAARGRILSITSSGGGIYTYSALLEAGRQLEAIDARVRHLILFADAADAEEKSAGSEGDGIGGTGSALDLAAGLASRGITLSVVALGGAEDRDAGFLADLAERGGGKFYLTGNALDLPQIFTAETSRIARRDFTEDPFLVSVVEGASPLVVGIDWGAAPFLYGANLVEPRIGGQVSLMTEEGTPLLADHRVGLGRVATFTSDIKARWALEWLSWPGFQTLWSQLIRGLLPGEAAGSFEIEVRDSDPRGGPGRGRSIVLKALDHSGWFLNGLRVTFVVQSEERGSFQIPAEQVGPGRYTAPLPALGGGVAAVSAIAENSPRPLGSVILGRAGQGEFSRVGTHDQRLGALARLSGGLVLARDRLDRAGLQELLKRPAGARLENARWDLAPATFALGSIALLARLVARRFFGSNQTFALQVTGSGVGDRTA